MAEETLVDEAFADCVLIGLGLGPRIDLGGAIQYGGWGGLYWWPVTLVFRNGSIPLDVFVELAVVGDYVFADGDHGGIALGINAGLGVRYYL